jgi:hypothetical protein
MRKILIISLAALLVIWSGIVSAEDLVFPTTGS